MNRYCQAHIDCIANFAVAIEPCLNPKENADKKMIVISITNLLKFKCHKQIALFIAEKGPECIGSKKEELITCYNENLGKYIGPNAMPDNLLQLTENYCRYYYYYFTLMA